MQIATPCSKKKQPSSTLHLHGLLLVLRCELLGQRLRERRCLLLSCCLSLSLLFLQLQIEEEEEEEETVAIGETNVECE